MNNISHVSTWCMCFLEQFIVTVGIRTNVFAQFLEIGVKGILVSFLTYG